MTAIDEKYAALGGPGSFQGGAILWTPERGTEVQQRIDDN